MREGAPVKGRFNFFGKTEVRSSSACLFLRFSQGSILPEWFRDLRHAKGTVAILAQGIEGVGNGRACIFLEVRSPGGLLFSLRSSYKTRKYSYKSGKCSYECQKTLMFVRVF